MTDYANAIQQKFLQKGEEKIPDPDDAPPTNTNLNRQSSLSARVDPPSKTVPNTIDGVAVTDLTHEAKARAGLPSDEVRGNLDADLFCLTRKPFSCFLLDFCSMLCNRVMRPTLLQSPFNR